MEKVHTVNEFRCHAALSGPLRKLPFRTASSWKVQRYIQNKRSGNVSDIRLQHTVLKYHRESFYTPVTNMSNMKSQTPGVSEVNE
jgi:hypothetical protein